MITKIFEDDDVYVMTHESQSPYLLVTFNNYATLGDGVRFWGDIISKHHRLNCLSFMAKTRSWFPARSMGPALEAADPFLTRFPVRVGYASSMGAYGLLKYGKALGLTAALAFAPQATIDPDLVRDADLRFRNYHQFCDPDMMPRDGDCCPQTYIFHDPTYAPDQWHIDRIAHIDGVRLVPQHGAGHETIKIVAGLEKPAPLVRLVAGPHSASDVAALMDRLRAQPAPPS